MKIEEHHAEPVRGLPAELPEGEAILWQGAPRWEVFARRVVKIRWLGFYFMFLVAWGLGQRLAYGATLNAATKAMAPLSILSVVAVGVLLAFAFFTARTTVYTITSRRVIMRFGIAMPMTIQIPFKLINTAGVAAARDGTGDIALALTGAEKIAYPMLWPHARPWRFTRAEPSLRSLPDVAEVSRILGRALAASAAQPARAVRIEVSKAAGGGAHLPATA